MGNKLETAYELDASQLLKELDQVISKSEITFQAVSRLEKTDPFKEAAKNAANFDRDLTASIKTYGQIEAAAEAFREEIKKVNLEHDKLITKKKEFEAAGKYGEYVKQLESVKGRLAELNKGLELSTRSSNGLREAISNVTGKLKEMITTSSAVEGLLGRFLPTITGLFGVLGVAVAGATVMIARAKQAYLEMNDAVLVVSGSQKNVTNNIEVLDSVASSLELTLRDVAAAYATLADDGLNPTGRQMKNLGVLSKELKTDFLTLSKAITEADKGQVSSLQNLGIQAVTNGDKIKVSFRGVTEEFKKGSGDSIKALDSISRQIEKTENSAIKISRFDFMDRLAKGMVDAENALADAADTADKKAYPAFDRLNKLIAKSRDGILDWAESFGIWVQVGWEHVKNDAMLLIAGFGYLSDIKNQGFSKANDNFSVAYNAFKKNRDEIFKSEQRSQSLVGKDQQKELRSDTVKIKPDDKEAIASAKKQKEELLRLEKEYQSEIKKLDKQYGKDKLEALKNDQLAYIKLKRDLDIEEINQEEKKVLLLKQLLSGAKKGNFSKDGKAIADSSAQLSSTERAPFDFGRQLVLDRAYLEEAKLINDNEKEITRIISNEFQVRLQNIESHYQDLYNKSKVSGFRLVDLEKKKQKEIAKVELDESLSKVDKRESQETTDAEINVIKAQISRRLDVEIEARKGLLELEKKFILEKIALIEASSDEEAQARLAGLRKAEAEVNQGLQELDDKSKEFKGMKGLLSKGFASLFGDEEDFNPDKAAEAFLEVADEIGQSVSNLYNTLNQLSQERINRIDQEIQKKQEQIDREKELNEEGVANNLSLRQRELAELKANRERAAKDQERIQKQQIIIDSVSQVSSMITASAKVYAALAGAGPFGVAIATGAVALMFGAFAAAKVKAFQLVKEQSAEKYEFGGEVGGRRHSEGGTLIEAEKGEYVTNRKSTSKYKALIEAINKDNRSGMLDYLVKDMLSGTGVDVSEPERAESVKFMKEYHASVLESKSEEILELRALRKELQEIKSGTNKIPDSQFVNAGENKIMEIGKNFKTITTLPNYEGK